jgi:hypothetical protein
LILVNDMTSFPRHEGAIAGGRAMQRRDVVLRVRGMMRCEECAMSEARNRFVQVVR